MTVVSELFEQYACASKWISDIKVVTICGYPHRNGDTRNYELTTGYAYWH